MDEEFSKFYEECSSVTENATETSADTENSTPVPAEAPKVESAPKPETTESVASNGTLSANFDKYKDHVRYEGSECIYTDPETKKEHVWNNEISQWLPRGCKLVLEGSTYKYTDLEGSTLVWNAGKSAWEKPDDTAPAAPQYGFDGENHTYTDPKDNTVYIWDKDKSAWFPKVDEDFMARYQMNYGFVDNTTQPPTEPEAEIKPEKRKATEPGWFEMDDEHNTKVYVTNLPHDISEQEFIDFMQKCGLVMKDIKTNKFKIKLYRDSNGELKGDALCDYIKVESVELALKVLDGSEMKGKKVSIQRAKFQMKGDYNPALKPKKKRKKEKEQEKKLQSKLLDWRPDKLRGEREKHERTVIIKNLFTPAIFDENVELILEYTEDIRSEANKCGTVRKVTLFDKNPEGVAMITFGDPEEADICVKLLNNRWFGKRRVIAETWDGKTKYKVVENEAETKARLDKWNEFLDSEDRVKK